jgi:hypothetical protein
MLPWLVLQENLGTVEGVITIKSPVVHSTFVDRTILVEGKAVYELNLT